MQNDRYVSNHHRCQVAICAILGLLISQQALAADYTITDLGHL